MFHHTVQLWGKKILYYFRWPPKSPLLISEVYPISASCADLLLKLIYNLGYKQMCI